MKPIAHTGSFSATVEELAKIPAFFRRDLLTLWSYRAAFFSDWVNMLVQVLLFYFLSRIIPSDRLPEYGGHPITYIQFVTVAIARSHPGKYWIGKYAPEVNRNRTVHTPMRPCPRRNVRISAALITPIPQTNGMNGMNITTVGRIPAGEMLTPSSTVINSRKTVVRRGTYRRS